MEIRYHLPKAVPIAFWFGVGLTFSFVAQIAAFRVLGVRGYGVFAVVYNTAAIASVLGAAGFDISALRFFSILQREMQSVFLGSTLRITVICSAAISLLFILIGMWALDTDFTVLLFGALSCFFWAYIRVASSLLRAIGRFSLSIIIDRPLRDGLIVAFCGGAMLLHQSLTVTTVIALVMLGGVLGLAIAAPSFLSFASDIKRREPAQERIWMLASLSLLVANVLQLTVSRIDVIMISYFAGPETAAILNVLAVISDIIIIPSSALLVVAMPRIARYYEAFELPQLKKYLFNYTILNIIGGLLVSAPIFAFPEIFIGFFGKNVVSYTDTIYLFILVITKLTTTIFAASAPLILMSGNVRGLIFTFIVIIAIKVLTLNIFAFEYGLVAGVWIVVAGALALMLVQTILAWNILNTRQTEFDRLL